MRIAPASRKSASVVLGTLFAIFGFLAISATTTQQAEAANGSCQYSCGEYGGNGCWCDDYCATAGDCCADFTSSCGSYGGSCAGACGGASYGCYCDALCTQYGDCCSDYGTQCAGLGKSSACTNDPSGVVDCCSGTQAWLGEDCQQVGPQIEEIAPTYDCHGECGAGCSWMNCGGGGACQIHDDQMAKGFWTFGQFATFPAAAVQWGACVVGTAVVSVVKAVKSAVTKAVKWIGKGIKKLFN